MLIRNMIMEIRDAGRPTPGYFIGLDTNTLAAAVTEEPSRLVLARRGAIPSRLYFIAGGRILQRRLLPALKVVDVLNGLLLAP